MRVSESDDPRTDIVASSGLERFARAAPSPTCFAERAEAASRAAAVARVEAAVSSFPGVPSSVVADGGVEEPGGHRDGDEELREAAARAAKAQATVSLPAEHRFEDPLAPRGAGSHGGGDNVGHSASTGGRLGLELLLLERGAEAVPRGPAARRGLFGQRRQHGDAERDGQCEGAKVEERGGVRRADVVAEEGEMRGGDPERHQAPVVEAGQLARKHGDEERCGERRGAVQAAVAVRRRRRRARDLVEAPLDDDAKGAPEVERRHRVLARPDQLHRDALAEDLVRLGRDEDVEPPDGERVRRSEGDAEADQRAVQPARAAQEALRAPRRRLGGLAADDEHVEAQQRAPRRGAARARGRARGDGRRRVFRYARSGDVHPTLFH
ncbi:hypothetical protein M885DRAFT_553563, partial [Pelagophyceae sp. CCMP2097]